MDKPKPLQVRLDPNPLFALVDLVNFAIANGKTVRHLPQKIPPLARVTTEQNYQTLVVTLFPSDEFAHLVSNLLELRAPSDFMSPASFRHEDRGLASDSLIDDGCKRLHEKLAEQVAASIERHAHILSPHLMPRIQNDGQVGPHRRDGHDQKRVDLVEDRGVVGQRDLPVEE